MNKRNYQKEMEEVIALEETRGKRLLLHSCCAPCSSAVLETLRKVFRITVFYYNPNIATTEEYKLRVGEQIKMITYFNELEDVREKEAFEIKYIEGDYEPELYYEVIKGLEKEAEGGKRCELCFDLRLAHAVIEAVHGKFDYVTTTLTISPMKNAEILNNIGEKLGLVHGMKWLPSDFKKKSGYQRSVSLSKEHDLYRQNYCGCAFSKAQAEALHE
ncbi:MAG: epoxyqueuosine reductase QueH [Lachnospiraceae bacterium]